MSTPHVQRYSLLMGNPMPDDDGKYMLYADFAAYFALIKDLHLRELAEARGDSGSITDSIDVPR